MRRCALALMLLLSAASAAIAGPLARGDVPAAAKWVVHFDATAFGRTDLYQAMTLMGVMDSREFSTLTRVAYDWGVTILDLDSLTLFGQDYTDHSVVAIVHAKLDREKFIAQVKAVAGCQESAHDSYTVYSWLDKWNKAGQPHRFFGCLADESTLVLASSEPAIHNALDTLAGKTPNLANAPKLASLDLAKNNGFILIAGDDLKVPASNLDRPAFLLNQISSGRIDIGEADGKVYVNVSAIAKTPEAAENMRTFLSGMIAYQKMLQSSDSADKPAPRLVETMTVTGKDTAIEIRMTSTYEEVFQFLVRMSEMKNRLLAASKPAASHPAATMPDANQSALR